jgi:hypothetical protein
MKASEELRMNDTSEIAKSIVTVFLQQKLQKMATKCLSKVADVGSHAIS